MQTYFGFIQTRINGNVAVFRLNDHREQFETPQTEISNPDKWFGALYYYIHQNTCEGVTYYTLLGVDFNNLFSRKRVIEELSLDRNGMPIFGTPIISVRNHLISRIIFEYSAQASMSLLYDTAKDMIVFRTICRPCVAILQGTTSSMDPILHSMAFSLKMGNGNTYPISTFEIRSGNNLPYPLHHP